MRPYGLRPAFDRGDDFGPPSKHRKLKSANRSRLRCLLHKQGRNDGRREIREQLKDG
jgi:hypothetical protein